MGKKKQKSVDIFKMEFEGNLGHPQQGNYRVTAAALDANGNPCGGGWVASFNDHNQAIACRQKILAVDPRHNPTIEYIPSATASWDW